MRIKSIAWDDNTVSHIARHGVDPQEVESICFDASPSIWKARHNRYFALGQTHSGRYLTIVFECAKGGQAKIITARAMSDAERKLYKRG